MVASEWYVSQTFKKDAFSGTKFHTAIFLNLALENIYLKKATYFLLEQVEPLANLIL